MDNVQTCDSHIKMMFCFQVLPLLFLKKFYILGVSQFRLTDFRPQVMCLRMLSNHVEPSGVTTGHHIVNRTSSATFTQEQFSHTYVL
jgi:hypothetical protein